jgi:hypothetical protein
VLGSVVPVDRTHDVVGETDHELRIEGDGRLLSIGATVSVLLLSDLRRVHVASGDLPTHRGAGRGEPSLD